MSKKQANQTNPIGYSIISLQFKHYQKTEEIIFFKVLCKPSQFSILPPLASVFVTGIAAQIADNLIANGVETTTVWIDTEQFYPCYS